MKKTHTYRRTKENHSLDTFVEPLTKWCNTCGCQQEVRESKMRYHCKTCGEWLR